MTVALTPAKLSPHFLEQMRKRRIPLAEVEACLELEPQRAKLRDGSRRLVYTNFTAVNGRGYTVVTSLDGVLITCYRERKPRKRKKERAEKFVSRPGKKLKNIGPAKPIRGWSEEE
jgi:hypothetical protein